MHRPLDLVRAEPAVEIDPALDQTYQELFGGRPLSLRDQKKLDKKMHDVAEEAAVAKYDALRDRRMQFARAICDCFAGIMHRDTADIVFTQSQASYDRVLLDTMVSAAQLAQGPATKFPGVSPGMAGKLAASVAYGDEATKRIRALNEVFPDSYAERHRQKGFFKRAGSLVGFQIAYIRPTHLLLDGFEGATDIPHAEALYGDSAAEGFVYLFDEAVDTARASNEQPDSLAFLEHAFRSISDDNYGDEIAATEEAFDKVS